MCALKDFREIFHNLIFCKTVFRHLLMMCVSNGALVYSELADRKSGSVKEP